jgi:competence protein ComEC
MKNKKIISSVIATAILIISLIAGCFYTTNENKENLAEESIEDILSVYYLNVGNADCTLLQFNIYSMLIDGANEADAPQIISYLKNNLKIKTLDYVIATHSDEDHISGLDKIIDSFDLGTFYMPNVDINAEINKDKELKEVISSVKNKNKEVETPQINDTFNMGDVKCDIKWVADETIVDKNKSSIVLETIYGSTKFLFMGDYEQPTENDLNKLGSNYKLPTFTQVDVLKVAHHRFKNKLFRRLF